MKDKSGLLYFVGVNDEELEDFLKITGQRVTTLII
jgi:hypothetical protein